MHALTSPSMPLFDTLLPAKEKVFADIQASSFFKPATRESIRPHGETLLSMAKLHERLSLLAQLELPCTIMIANPPLHLRHAVIKNVELGGENLSIAGEDFNLHLRGPNIHSIRLVNHGDEENGITSVDIQHSPGMLYASIQSAPDGIGEAVWRDVMENPSLSLA